MSDLFTATLEERAIIASIAHRAADIMERSLAPDRHMGVIHIMMYLEACHCNGCPLRLNDMEHASQFDLMHDILGLRNHLDTRTGKLEGCFLPRFSGGKRERRASRHD